MRRKIIAGNWKMHGTRAQVAELLAALAEGVMPIPAIEWIIFPPYIFLEQAAAALQSLQNIQWGAQTVSEYDNGAYTGEISASMLQEAGCRYVLVGHSERRLLLGETSEVVAKKFIQAQRYQLSPVLCVGETLAQRNQGLTEQVIVQQLETVLAMAGGIAAFKNTVIAYEPVWAIGTGEAASPQQAQTVHAMIRQHLAKLDSQTAADLSILYGGSVKADNAAAIFSEPDIDGGLVGGASLDAKTFLEIGRCIK